MPPLTQWQESFPVRFFQGKKKKKVSQTTQNRKVQIVIWCLIGKFFQERQPLFYKFLLTWMFCLAFYCFLGHTHYLDCEIHSYFYLYHSSKCISLLEMFRSLSGSQWFVLKNTSSFPPLSFPSCIAYCERRKSSTDTDVSSLRKGNVPIFFLLH